MSVLQLRYDDLRDQCGGPAHEHAIFVGRTLTSKVTARVVPIGVNGGPGFEFHRDGKLRAIEAVEVRDGQIYRMHHFMQPAVVSLFAR